MTVDLLAVERPPDVPLDRWLRASWHARRRLIAARLAASPPPDLEPVPPPRPRREECARGHTLDDAYEQASRPGHRECRACRRDRDRERARRRRAAGRAAATPTPSIPERQELAS